MMQIIIYKQLCKINSIRRWYGPRYQFAKIYQQNDQYSRKAIFCPVYYIHRPYHQYDFYWTASFDYDMRLLGIII